MQVYQLNLKDDEKVAFVSDFHLDSNTVPSRIDDLFQTVINKAEDILKKCKERNVKVLCWEGDLINRITIPFSAINSFIEVLIKFREEGIQNFAICGNHDIIRNSMDYLDRSPLQTLFASGLMTHINLENRLCINDSLMITPVDYTEYPPKVGSKRHKTELLLCHMFINANEFMSDEKHNLRTEDIIELGYDIIVAGHDHAEYPTIDIGSTTIYRHGSVLRGTAHDYNFERKPNILVCNNVNNVCKDTIEKVILEHRPYKDIASNYVLNKKQVGTISGLKDLLSNLADKLSVSSDADGDRILEIIKTDPELPNESRLKLLNYITEMS